ncbi:MAG: glutathione S-transferase family protein [Pseudomonadota bacterium]
MKVYHCPGTRSVRILWLLEELGLEYDIVSMPLGDPKMREPAYLKIHPAGRVPALEDGEVTLFESGAIVQYLLARHAGGRLQPDVGSAEFPVYLQWLHYAEGMMMPQVNIIVVETKFLPPEKRNDTNVARATKLLTRMLAAVDKALEKKEFLAGEFSGADIMTGHACTVAARLGADLSATPNVRAYVDRLNARPALAKAFATT